MDSANPRPSLFRFSLRELLLLLAFFAIGCAALRYVGGLWLIGLSSCVLLLFMIAAVLASVDRGHRQAQAIGFALCVAIYGVLFWSAPSPMNVEVNPELDPEAGRLPTTKAMAPLFDLIVKGSYHDAMTGKEIAVPTPGLAVYFRETPDRGQFMATAHLLWMLLLGYLGSRVALWAYARRQRSQQT
jgi:hypothetical protein